MSGITQNAYSVTPLTATGTTTIKTGTGVLGGVLFASGTSPSVTLYDNTTATGTPMAATMTAASTPMYVPFPAGFGTGLTVVVGGTSPQVSILWAPN